MLGVKFPVTKHTPSDPRTMPASLFQSQHTPVRLFHLSVEASAADAAACLDASVSGHSLYHASPGIIIRENTPSTVLKYSSPV